MKLHREGTTTVIISLALAVVLGVTVWLTMGILWRVLLLTAILVTLYIAVRFFRVPNRKGRVQHQEDLIYAPCDGKVVEVTRAKDHETLEGECLKVAIFMSVFNVHVNYYPTSGQVSYQQYHKGRFLVAWLPKSSTDNEHSTVVVDRPDGARVLARQIAGAVARRIATYAREGHQVKVGEELGFIRFGSRVDVYMPLEAEALVSVGDKVQGSITPLARLAMKK